MKRLLLMASIGMALLAFAHRAAASDWVVDYRASPAVESRDGTFHAIETTLKIRREGKKVIASSPSSGLGGHDCSEGRWRCVRIPYVLNFAINADWQTIPEAWEFDTVRYHTLGARTVKVLGQDVDVALICAAGGGRDSHSPTRDACFDFSPRLGVVLIHFHDNGFGNEGVQTFVLASDRGLFARAGSADETASASRTCTRPCPSRATRCGRRGCP